MGKKRSFSISKISWDLIAAFRLHNAALNRNGPYAFDHLAVQKCNDLGFGFPTKHMSGTDAENLEALCRFLDEVTLKRRRPPAGTPLSTWIGQEVQTNPRYLAALKFVKETFTVKATGIFKKLQSDDVPQFVAPDLNELRNDRSEMVTRATAAGAGASNSGASSSTAAQRDSAEFYGALPDVLPAYGETSLVVPEEQGANFVVKPEENGLYTVYREKGRVKDVLMRNVTAARVHDVDLLIGGQWKDMRRLINASYGNVPNGPKHPVLLGAQDPHAEFVPVEQDPEDFLAEQERRAEEGLAPPPWDI